MNWSILSIKSIKIPLAVFTILLSVYPSCFLTENGVYITRNLSRHQGWFPGVDSITLCSYYNLLFVFRLLLMLLRTLNSRSLSGTGKTVYTVLNIFLLQLTVYTSKSFTNHKDSWHICKLPFGLYNISFYRMNACAGFPAISERLQ